MPRHDMVTYLVARAKAGQRVNLNALTAGKANI